MMSDDAANHSVFVPEPATGDVTAGQLLRQAREAAGMHIAALSVAIKVPVKKIEALEADQLHTLHDAVFVRALASSICRTLKVDANAVLKLLPQGSTPKLDTEERAINTPFRAPGDFKRSALPGLVKRPAVLWVAVLLVGVLLVAFFPQAWLAKMEASIGGWFKTSTSAQAPQTPATPPVEESTGPGMTNTPSQIQIQAPAEVATVTPPPTNPPSTNPQPGTAAVPMPAQVMAPASAPASPAPVTAADTASGSILSIKAQGQTWVGVTDANKVVQLQKVLNQGDVAVVSGTPPLSVVIGRADMVQVEVRGQPFAVGGVGQSNVARFEVK